MTWTNIEDKEQCSRCLRWFKNLARHNCRQGTGRIGSVVDPPDIDRICIPERLVGYGDKLELGFAMLKDDIEG